jgi:hypothetical protein
VHDVPEFKGNVKANHRDARGKGIVPIMTDNRG